MFFNQSSPIYLLQFFPPPNSFFLFPDFLYAHVCVCGLGFFYLSKGSVAVDVPPKDMTSALQQQSVTHSSLGRLRAMRLFHTGGKVDEPCELLPSVA